MLASNPRATPARMLRDVMEENIFVAHSQRECDLAIVDQNWNMPLEETARLCAAPRASR